MQGYAAAAFTSCSIALVLREFALRYLSHFKGPKGFVISGINNLIAIICAGTANLYFMRQKEIKEGVTVSDHEGVSHGKSLVAGKKAIAQTIYSRVATVPVIVTSGPMAAIYMLESRRMLRSRWTNAAV